MNVLAGIMTDTTSLATEVF